MSNATAKHAHYDVAAIKQAAAGRWPEILNRLAGVPIDSLDGNHHPCPQCGGTDRFRLVDAAAGAVFCNQCFNTNNGDGLAALGHYCGWSFGQTLQLVGDHLGVHPSANGCNGHAKSNGKPKKATDEASLTKGIKPVDHKPEIVEVFLSKYGESKPPITADGIRRCGGSLVDWMGFRSIRLDGRTPIDSPTITAVVLLKLDGEPFPAFGKVGERKTHTVKGSVNSWLASGDVTTAETIIDVEGVTDLLAVVSAGLPAGWVAATNTAGAKARGKLPRAWAAGKRIIVAGDADEPGKDGMRLAAAAYLAAGASEVLLGKLPYQIEKDHGKDLRDWLLEGHTLAELPTEAVTPEHIAAEAIEKADEKERPAVELLAEAIYEGNHFAQDAGGKLYRFVDGCYRRRAEDYILRQVKDLCVLGVAKWSSRIAREVCEFIRVDAPELWERPPIDVVNVKNGLLRVADRVLLPHTPDHLSPVQLPITYDPAAKCPNIDAFVSQVFPADALDLAWEIPAWLMLPDTSIQKAVLLTGEGANGKSTYLNLVATFIGKLNISGVSLHKLEADKFAAARLIGKLANVCPDLPSEHLAGTSIFKAITGGDTLVAEYKFRDSFDFTPFARLVFSANHPPRSSDSSHAFFRRWQVVPFDQTFGPNEQTPEIPRDILDAMLTTPTELSGLLNHALDALDRLRGNRRFSEPESVKRAWEDFQATTDPLTTWLDTHTVLSPDAVTPRDELRGAYNQHAREAGAPPIGQAVFGRRLQKLRPEVGDGQRTIRGRRQWCYVGVGIKAAAQAAQDAQDNPLLVRGGNYD